MKINEFKLSKIHRLLTLLFTSEVTMGHKDHESWMVDNRLQKESHAVARRMRCSIQIFQVRSERRMYFTWSVLLNGRSRLSKVIDFGNNQEPVCNFLLLRTTWYYAYCLTLISTSPRCLMMYPSWDADKAANIDWLSWICIAATV